MATAAISSPRTRPCARRSSGCRCARPARRRRTLDEASRLLLAQAAAEKAGLNEVGLSFEDVYGVIEAETSWIARSGKGRNGVTSLGLAQFEPRTAKGLGLKNPNDPVQAVYAAAHVHEARRRVGRRQDRPPEAEPEQRAAKIREGVSIYYNLSIKGRNKWDGVNTAQAAGGDAAAHPQYARRRGAGVGPGG